MDVSQPAARFAFLPVRLRIVPRQVLKLPAVNKCNTLRGAFGTAFRRLVCIPQCREVRVCPLGQTCPYQIIFEPAPPSGADRLSKNQDIPRPFVFRPPLDVPPDVSPGVAPGFSPALAALKGGATKTSYEPGEAFDFTLTLLGKAVDFLPYFILAFREVAREGTGLNRARGGMAAAAKLHDIAQLPIQVSGVYMGLAKRATRGLEHRLVIKVYGFSNGNDKEPQS